MASYWEKPDPNQFIFTPSTPPAQEALGALQAKTQYWLQGAAQVKGQYDAILGKELSHATSIAKVESFRKQFDERLKTLAKKDFSIGENKTAALKEFDPIVRDRGIIVDETTTSNYNSILSQAKSDANKNGGKYYNQDSVEYAGQMLQRYKGQADNSNTEYNDILKNNAYIPYNEKAQRELAEFVKTASKEKVEHPYEDPTNNLRIVVKEGPAYKKEDLAALARETLSPAALQMYELQGKVQFNRYQLAAKTPEQMHQIGSEYKAQIDTMYNEKIANTKAYILDNTQKLALISKNHPEAKEQIDYLNNSILQAKEGVKGFEKRRDDTRLEYFTDPANWRLGEAYAAEMFMEQKVRNTTTALSNREYSTKWQLNQAEAKQQELEIHRERLRILKEKESKKAIQESESGIDPNRVIERSVNAGTNDTDPVKRGNARYEAAKTIEVDAYKSLQTPLLDSLEITVDVDGNSTTLDRATPRGDMLITDRSLQISDFGLKNLTNILSSATTGLKKDPNGKVDLSNLTVAQVKTELDAILADKDKVQKVINYAAFENNNLKELSDYHYQLGLADSKKSNDVHKFSKIWEEELRSRNLLGDGVKVTNFNLDDPDNILKLGNQRIINQVIKQNNLSPNEVKELANFISGRISELSNKFGVKQQVPDYSVAGSPTYKTVFIPSSLGIMAQNLKDSMVDAKAAIKNRLAQEDNITYSTKGRTFTIQDKLTEKDDRNEQLLRNRVNELIQGSIGSAGGDNSDENVQAFDFFRNTTGVLDAVNRVSFVTGTTNTKPYMELDFDVDKLNTSLEKKGLRDEHDVLDNVVKEKHKVKIYLTDKQISEYAKDPDRDDAILFRNPVKINTASGHSFSMKNVAVNEPGKIEASLSGEISAVTKGVDNSTIVIKPISFREKDYESLAKLFSGDKQLSEIEFRNYLKNTSNIHDIGMKLSEQDAIAYALTQQFGKKFPINSKGEIIIDIKKLTPEELVTFTNIMQKRKLN